MNWEELGRTLSDIGRDAADKALEAKDALVLKQKAMVARSRLRRAYEAVGKAYYEQELNLRTLDEDAEPADFEALFADVAAAQDELEQYEAQIRK